VGIWRIWHRSMQSERIEPLDFISKDTLMFDEILRPVLSKKDALIDQRFRIVVQFPLFR